MAWLDRLQIEAADLRDKMEKLDVFLYSDAYCALPDADQALLLTQYWAMQNYVNILDERLGRSSAKPEAVSVAV